VPLGSFFGVSYDEVTFPLSADDVFVFCSDGVSEAMNAAGEEFTPGRLLDVVAGARDQPASEIVARIAGAVEAHRAGFPPNDDTTIVALRITA
jgi:sigma-B regulation protein RsbU (phosphoserine phosphatase)